MIKSMSTAGDRLLALFVPRVVAKADPCGVREWVNCGCRGNYERYMKSCCTIATGVCGPCVRRGSC